MRVRKKITQGAINNWFPVLLMAQEMVLAKGTAGLNRMLPSHRPECRLNLLADLVVSRIDRLSVYIAGRRKETLQNEPRMRRYYSGDNNKKELAMLFQVLTASGYTNRTAGRILNIPWITLYKWGQRHLNVSGFDKNTNLLNLLDQAGKAIAKARTLPIHRNSTSEPRLPLF